MRILRDVAPGAADSQSQVDLDGSVADYDYDNDRDAADYCPDLPLSVSQTPLADTGLAPRVLPRGVLSAR